MEHSGKHRFHGLEHDSKMRLSSKPNLTPLPCEAATPQKNAKSEKRKRRTEDGKRAAENPAVKWRNKQTRELSVSSGKRGGWKRRKQNQENGELLKN